MNLSDVISIDPLLGEYIRRLEDARQSAFKTIPAKAIIPERDVVRHLQDIRPGHSGARLICGLAGFPASGKTTLATSIARDINSTDEGEICAAISMDGFHRSNEYLARHGLEEKKGAPETYDAIGYGEFLGQLKNTTDRTVLAPRYDRPTHQVLENSVEVPATVKLIVTEGIYVGYRSGPWSVAANQVSRVYFLDQKIDICLQRIIDRNLAARRTIDVIIGKLKNDLINSLHTVRIVSTADYIITPR
jgi:pantothenate kinase